MNRPLTRWMILFTTGLLAACANLGTNETGIVTQPLNSGSSPDRVVSDFLNNWDDKNFAAMYAALSPQSQALYTQPVFDAFYQEAEVALTLTSVTYSIHETTVQGAAAAVRYDLALESPVFGTIEDSGRTMRLVQGAGGWGVAWSSMDIVDGLSSGARLSVQTQRSARENIYDRDGNVLVEQGGTKIALYAAQQNMPNVDDCLTLLAEVLMRQRYDLVAMFALFNPETIFYLGEIDPETDALYGQELDATCAVTARFPRDTRRYVGNGGAVHITGYIGYIPPEQLESWKLRGYSESDLIGLTGVENTYEEELGGQPEKVLRIVSTAGVTLRELAGKTGVPPQPVTLTIDRNLQLAAAQAMADAFNYAEPNWAAPGIAPGAGLVALDVNTGEILALVSYPFFDPGIFNPDTPALVQTPSLIADLAQDSRQPFANRATQEQYFPGSTFKIITTSAAASERLMSSTDQFLCELIWDGRERFGDTSSPRSDWRRFEPEESPVSQPAGLITMSQALTASCNPFFYEMGARLFIERGPDVLTGYARRMGLGAQTGLEALREVGGTVPAATSVEQGINEAIGQGGIQVTILQMARLVAGIANGGTLYRPYLVAQIGGMDGSEPSYQGAPLQAGDMGLGDEVLALVQQGMCAVTTDTTLGTAWFVFEGATYHACGKTGTAQSGRQEPYGWFVAYAPAENPQIAVAAMVEFSREGSETAAPIIRRVIDAYLGQPQAAYPEWWNTGPYVPLQIPVNETGG